MRRLENAVPRPEERIRTSGEAERRPKRARHRHGRYLALALVLAAGIGVTAAGTWLAVSGRAAALADAATAAVVAATAKVGLAVHDICVEGAVRTPRKQIIAALGLRLGEPMLAFELEEARRRVEALPWIRAARIERRLPDVVHVAVAERTAIALWQQNGRHVLLDAAGEPIAVDPRPFGHLPVLVGDDAPANAAGLMSALAQAPGLRPRVKAAVRVGGRRWDLILDDVTAGTRVRLPERGAAAALARLASLEDSQALLTPQVAMVDLRLPDRLTLRRRDEADSSAAAGRPGEAGA